MYIAIEAVYQAFPAFYSPLKHSASSNIGNGWDLGAWGFAHWAF